MQSPPQCPLHSLPFTTICLICEGALLCSQCHAEAPQSHGHSIANLSELHTLAQKERDKVSHSLSQVVSVKSKIEVLVDRVQSFTLAIQNRLQTLISELESLRDDTLEHIRRTSLRFFDFQPGEIKPKNYFQQWDLQLDTLLSNFACSENCQLWLYSEDLKNKDIRIQKLNRAVKARDKKVSNAVALIEPHISKSETSTIHFKINKLMASVAVGLCNKDTLKKNHFLFTGWDRLGHGCYMISASGCKDFWIIGDSYNSENAQTNFKKTEATFKTGSTVRMQFDPSQKQVHFTILGTNQHFSMAVEETYLYPCVYLSTGSEEVEIFTFLGF